MYEVTIDLYADWIRTVKDLFRMNGQPLPEELTDEETALRYYLQHAGADTAEALVYQNKQRFQMLQAQILEHLDDVIGPDIVKRTGYKGTTLKFSWVYQEGEHIIEHCSEYRIPLQ